MSQIGRNVTDAVDGMLNGKRYLIHDRDPLFTAEFLKMLADVGVKSVKLPPRSPNLNAHAERFVADHQRILPGADDPVWRGVVADSHSQLRRPLRVRFIMPIWLCR
jgi:transposase InsO family protein